MKIMHPILVCLKDCEACESTDSLVRVPSHFVSTKEAENISLTGDLVKEKIEEFREDLNQEKEKLKSKEYKP